MGERWNICQYYCKRNKLLSIHVTVTSCAIFSAVEMWFLPRSIRLREISKLHWSYCWLIRNWIHFSCAFAIHTIRSFSKLLMSQDGKFGSTMEQLWNIWARKTRESLTLSKLLRLIKSLTKKIIFEIFKNSAKLQASSIDQRKCTENQLCLATPKWRIRQFRWGCNP